MSQPTAAHHRFRRAAKQFSRVLRLGGPAQAFRFLSQLSRGINPVEIKIRGIATPLYFRPDQTDLDVLWGAFGKRECDVNLSPPPKLVIDGGANAGFTTVFFAAKYPQAQVIAVEPDAGNCEMIRRNSRDYSNVRVVQAALWDTQAALQITNPGVACWSFQVGEAAPSQSGSIMGITLSELLDQSRCAMIDLLKLDIEGAEERLFAGGAHEWIGRVRLILIEIHGPAAEQAVLSAIRPHNFTTSRQQEKFVFTKNPQPIGAA